MSIDLGSRKRQKALAQSKKNPSGFDALGVRVLARRLTAALDKIRELAPTLKTEDAMSLIGRAANYIEQDKPYEAQRVLFQDAPNWESNEGPPSVELPCESPLDLCGALMIYS
jgi:hypothetical protein